MRSKLKKCVHKSISFCIKITVKNHCTNATGSYVNEKVNVKSSGIKGRAKSLAAPKDRASRELSCVSQVIGQMG